MNIKKMSWMMILILVLFSGCSNSKGELPKADALIEGKIVDVDDKSFLFATDSSGLIMVGLEHAIYDDKDQISDVSELEYGMWIEIGFSGEIMESYPAQLSGIEYIRIIEQRDNLVGFYQTVIADLWQKDAGLNSDAKYIAFDLSQISNLNEVEKQALVYLASRDNGLIGLTGTYDELVEQGYIDDKNLYFEEGVLITFDIHSTSDKSMKFDVTKWRSGLGAYFFMDCEATKTKDGWIYEIGSEAIS